MFGIDKEEESQEQDPKSQVLQEILDFAQSKMLGKMKSKAPVGMEVSIGSTESPEGMEAEEYAKEGESGPETCPHCGKAIGGGAC